MGMGNCRWQKKHISSWLPVTSGLCLIEEPLGNRNGSELLICDYIQNLVIPAQVMVCGPDFLCSHW